MNKYKPEELKIAVGTIYHGKPKEVKRMFDSFSHLGVDYWILVGGAFKDAPDQGENHDVANVISSFRYEQNENGSQSIEVLDTVMNGANEYMKRQKYIDIARIVKANALFIVDTDEYAYENDKWGFEKNWDKFRRFFYSYLERYPEHNVYSIRFIRDEFLSYDFHPRCWAYPEKMSYVQNSHYKFGNAATDDLDDPLFNHQPTFGTIEGISLKHDHTLRSDEDMKNRRGYQDFLVKYEQFLERPDLTGGDPMAARRMALREMAPFEDNCICMKCFKMKGIDPATIMDTRPRDKRDNNPYITGIPL